MLTDRENAGVEMDILNHNERPNLYLLIRNLLLDEVTNQIEEDLYVVKELAKMIRKKISIHSATKRDPFNEVAGVDAGSHILPLASRRFAVISALVYTLPSGERFFREPESFCFPYRIEGGQLGGIINIRREAKLYETATQYVEGDPDVRLILVDGPLAFSNWWNMVGGEADRSRLVNAVSGFLNICREKGVSVAGVIKRPSARYLIYNLGLQRLTEFPDAFLLLHCLRSGERTDIFSPRSAAMKSVQRTPFMDAIGHPVYSFYIRLSKEWAIPPVRIDLPAFCLGDLNDIADYCYFSSVWKGIPLPIIRADEEVKVSRRFIREVYKDIVGRVGRTTAELSHLAPYWGEGQWMGT